VRRRIERIFVGARIPCGRRDSRIAIRVLDRQCRKTREEAHGNSESYRAQTSAQ